MKFAIKVLLFMLIIWFISMFVSSIRGTERQDASYNMKMFIIMLGVAALMALWWFTKGFIKG